MGITVADIRSRIVKLLAVEGRQNFDELCKHNCFQFMPIRFIRIALEELVFERIITADHECRYGLMNLKTQQP